MIKKSILFFCGAAVISTVTAFTFVTVNNFDRALTETNLKNAKNKALLSDMDFAVGPRYAAILKDAVTKATTSLDFIRPEEYAPIVDVKLVLVGELEEEKKPIRVETSDNKNLTDKQLELLRSLGYSSHFSVRTDFTKLNDRTGKLENDYYDRQLTIVPEKQASYSAGRSAIVEYLIENLSEAMPLLDADQLRPSKLSFKVTKNGQLEKLNLEGTTGYPALDVKIIELMNKLPGTWTPAENARGEKIEQELVLNIGMVGC